MLGSCGRTSSTRRSPKDARRSGAVAGRRLELELGVVDEQDERVYLRIHTLAFDVDGREPPAG
jgi:hypothetical protein